MNPSRVKMLDFIQNLYDSEFFNFQINSVVIDFALINFMNKRTSAYLSIAFQLDEYRYLFFY